MTVTTNFSVLPFEPCVAFFYPAAIYLHFQNSMGVTYRGLSLIFGIAACRCLNLSFLKSD